MKKKIDWKVLCVGLVCLTGLELYALRLGYNGTILNIVIFIIAIAIGITIDFPSLMKIIKK